MTTTKVILLILIFGIGIYFFWRAVHKKKVIKVDLPPDKFPPVTKTKTTLTANEWNDSKQRQRAAQEAATKMREHSMHNNGSEAVQIRQVIHKQNVKVNISALNSAQDKIMRICAHAERIRNDIGRYRNNPTYLKQLYCNGVGVSDEAHKLRCEIKALRDMLYHMGATNPSIRVLHKKVNAFYQSVYEDEVELNNRNRILRTYIGKNFGPAEQEWNNAIERRAMAKKAS